MDDHQKHIQLHIEFIKQNPEVLEGIVIPAAELLPKAELILQYGIEGITEFDLDDIPFHLKEEAVRHIDYILSWLESNLL